MHNLPGQVFYRDERQKDDSIRRTATSVFFLFRDIQNVLFRI